LLKKKIEAFRDLKIRYIQPRISEKVLLSLVIKGGIALFEQSTSVNLEEVVGVYEGA
jgi:hypothetical protein